MSDIKTKDMIKDIKSINKSTYLKNMKNAFVKTKEKAEEINTPDSDTPHTYATESISAKAKDISSAAVHKVERFGRQSLKETPDTLTKAKTGAANIKQRMHTTSKIIKTKRSAKAAANSSKSAGKAAANTVKTSKQAAQVSVKTAQATMKASQKAAQTAKAAAKATAQTAKVTAKAVVAAVKTTVAAVKGLITLIVAGGWVAVVIILVICMVGLLISSPFGIFFSSDPSQNGNSKSMPVVVNTLNSELKTKIDEIINSNPHDILILNGSLNNEVTITNWNAILSVYAVKTATASENPYEVATLDDNKISIIRNVFWDMVSIEFHTDKTTHESNDSATESTVKNEIILYITVTGKTADEMAVQYEFNIEQRKHLEELMKPEYMEWFAQLIGN